MIELDHVTKTFGDGADRTVAVDDLSLSVAAGEIVALVGSSGSGKTTTLRMINRLIEPSSGRITVDGRDVVDAAGPRAAARHRLRHPAGRAVPAPHRARQRRHRAPPARVGQGRGPNERSRELLDLVGLDAGLADRYPAQLSGGQQQRVGVARALAADPPVLLMDEPFGAVDPIVRAQLQREFARLQRELGKTVVFVTHDVDEAIILGDRIAVLEPGGRLAQLRLAGRAARQPGVDVRRRLPRRPHRRVRGRRAPSATASSRGSCHRDGPTADGVVSLAVGAAVERAAARRQLGRHLVLHAAARPLHGARRDARLRVRPARSPTWPCAGTSTYPVLLTSPTSSTPSRRSRCSCCCRRGSATSTTSRSSSPWRCTRS